MENAPDQRLRPHPEARFASPQLMIDLGAVAERLRGEPGTGERGHRQETLYRGQGVTIALFAFDRFTHLPEHKAYGVVSMQALRGHLKITVEDQTHELQAGQMLVLAPGIRHAVAAEDESELLVTVHLTR